MESMISKQLCARMDIGGVEFIQPALHTLFELIREASHCFARLGGSGELLGNINWFTQSYASNAFRIRREITRI